MFEGAGRFGTSDDAFVKIKDNLGVISMLAILSVGLDFMWNIAMGAMEADKIWKKGHVSETMQEGMIKQVWGTIDVCILNSRSPCGYLFSQSCFITTNPNNAPLRGNPPNFTKKLHQV